MANEGNPLVSIVTLCWNRKKDILESLEGISKIDYEPLEVIVVDNASTDGTKEAIAELYPNVKVMVMDNNIGIEAYNHGFEAAKGEYIVILDDDSFPHPQAVKRMVKKFAANPKLGVVAFDVRNYYKYDEVAAEVVEEAQSQAVSKDYYMGFNGAGAGVRKDVFKKAGYYPAEFFLYMNEADSSYRILDMGYEITFFSDVVSYHKYSPQNRKSWRAPYYYTRNAFFMVWKNLPLGLAVKRTIYLMYMSFYSAMEQKSFIYIKAMFHAFTKMKLIKGKRKPVNADVAHKLRVPLNVSFSFFR